MNSRFRCWLCLMIISSFEELKATPTGNHTYSHIIRINSWTDASRHNRPLPLSAYLSTNSSPSSHSSSSSPSTTASNSSANADANCCPPDGQSTFQVARRQVDHLHSCIEAKCSSWNSGNYLDCIYRHCITNLQIHGRRRRKRDADVTTTTPLATTTGGEEEQEEEGTPNPDSFDEPEGRFLLLPVSVDSSGSPQQLPEILGAGSEEQKSALRRAQRVLSLVARRGLVRNIARGPASARTAGSTSNKGAAKGDVELNKKAEMLISKKTTQSALASKSLARTKRSVGERFGAVRAGTVGGNHGKQTSLVEGKRKRRAVFGQTSSSDVNSSLRRSFNDIADVCVEHHCGHLQPHSINFFQCVEMHCTGKIRV